MSVTRFDGASLPAPWSAVTPAGSSVTVANGYCTLHADVGSDFDSLSGSIVVPQGPRISIPVSGSFDYAVSFGNYANVIRHLGVDLLALDVPNSHGIRFAQFVSTIVGRDIGWFGRRVTPSVTNNITLTAPPSNLWGPRGFMRLTWDQTTGTFTFRSSHTGKPGTWHQHVQFVNTFVPTTFEIDMTAAEPDAFARDIRIYTFVDMSTQPADDATDPPADPTRPELYTADLSGSALPAGLTATEAGGANVTVAGGICTMTTDSNVDGSYTWVTSPETFGSDHGMLLRYRFPQPSVQNTFVGVIIRAATTTDLPSSRVLTDKFRPGTGFLAEINGGGTFGDIIRILDASPVDHGEDFEGAQEFYGFTMKLENLDAPVTGTSGDWIWCRIEAQGGYFRSRFWYDIDPEPETWQYEGEDWTQLGGGGIALSLGHNDSTTGGGAGVATFEFDSLEVYETVGEVPVPSGSATAVTSDTIVTAEGSAPTPTVNSGDATPVASDTSVSASGSVPTPSVPAGSAQGAQSDTTVSASGSAPEPVVPHGSTQAVATITTVSAEGSTPTPTVPSGSASTLLSVTTVTADGHHPGAGPSGETPTMVAISVDNSLVSISDEKTLIALEG